VVVHAHFFVGWTIVVVATIVELLVQMHFLHEVEAYEEPN